MAAEKDVVACGVGILTAIVFVGIFTLMYLNAILHVLEEIRVKVAPSEEELEYDFDEEDAR